MRVNLKALLILLVLVTATGTGFAQDTPAAETRNRVSMVAALNSDISELQFLSNRLSTASSIEREFLVYRQDERRFKLLADFDNLVAELAAMPDGTPQKTETLEQLATLGEGVGEAVFDRINEIKHHNIKAIEMLESLSGGALIAAQANIQSMESIRIKYYEALINHLESRRILGLASDELRNRLDPELYFLAETLTAQIEYTNATYTEVQTSLETDPENSDKIATLTELDRRHKVHVSRLESIISVLDQLQLDSSEYKAVLLQQAGGFSISLFSLKALSSVFRESWIALKSSISENAGDIFFRLFLFIAVLVVFRIFSRITKRIVRTTCDRSSLDMSALLKNILVSTSGGTVMAVGILMALSQVGISLAPMLAGLGVAGFIVGFALQDSLGNFAAGAMILIYRPFDVDDFVEVTGASGLVKKMNLVSTTITTFDNQTLVVPNSKIWGDVIKNVTAQKERRVDLEFGIGYDDDIKHAERVLTEIVTAHEKVLSEPAPMIKLHSLGDSSVNFIVRPWTKTEDYWDVYWDIMREVKLRFDLEGISIPYPQTDVHLYPSKEDQPALP